MHDLSADAMTLMAHCFVTITLPFLFDGIRKSYTFIKKPRSSQDGVFVGAASCF